MHRAFIVRKWALLVAMVLLVGVLSGHVSSAGAATGWPQDVVNVGAQRVIAHPDGSVTVGKCSSVSGTSYDMKTFSSSGVLVKAINTLSNQSEVICFNNGVVGKNNTIFTQRFAPDGKEYVVAYKTGAEIWKYPVATARCPKIDPYAMVIGSDGYLYLAFSYYCNGNKQELVKLDTTNGVQLFRKSIGTKLNAPLNGLQPYGGGLVLHEQFPDTFRFFSNAGIEDTAKKYSPVIVSGEALNSWNVQPDGRVFVVIDYSSFSPPVAGCELTNFMKRVVRRNLDKTLTTYNTGSYCLASRGQIQVTPSGGAAIMTGNHRSQPSAQGLLFVGSSTIVKPLRINVTDRKDANSSSDSLRVDLRGNILLARTYTYDNEGDIDHHFDVVMFGADGVQRSRFSSEVWKTGNQDDFRVWGSMMDIAPGAAYVVVGNATAGGVLHRLTFSGLDYEYQRGVMLAVTPKPVVAERNYVALGDSFSSGEGAPPFYGDTARPGANECHRSMLAYADLLDQDPSLSLTKKAFKACSGAETKHIKTDTQWPDQPKQVSAISADTNVVTMSIGGNDIGFKQFLLQCLFLECDQPAVRDGFYAKIDSLSTSLTTTYAAVLSEKGNRAQVYVLGYPNLLGASGCSQTDSQMNALNALVGVARATPGPDAAEAAVRYVALQAGLTAAQTDTFIESGAFKFSPGEVTTAQALVARLNNKINASVGTNVRLKFIDPTKSGSPFIGHELCTSDPYFNGLSIDTDTSKVPYSFHPNAQGQRAYAQLVKSNLS